MSKLYFGENSVVPVKDLRTDFVTGEGIDSEQFANNTISVDSTVIRNIAPNGSNSVVNQWKNSITDVNQQVAYGVGTTTSGTCASAFGSNTYASQYSVALGSRANASGYGNGYSIAVGSYSKSGPYSIAIGPYSNNDNNSAKEGRISIGAYSDSGNAPGNIAIGHRTKVSPNNDTYPSIVIGNDHDLTNSGAGVVVIGGYDYTNVTQIANEKNFGYYSVAIGLNAGGQKDGLDTSTSVCIGAYSTVNGPRTVAMGYGSQALGDSSIAIGCMSEANPINKSIESCCSIAIGKNARATKDGNMSVGYGTNTIGSGCIAIGKYAMAGGEDNSGNGTNNSIAIGCFAESLADNAIQIGEGINSQENTVKIRNYTLLQNNGTLPKERLSTYLPTNGQVLYYDENLGCLAWKNINSNSGGGHVTIPVASKTELGGVKIGNGLNITLDGTLSVQNSTQDVNWGSIKGKLKNQTDLQNTLDSKQNIIQYSVMPTPTSKLDGSVVQYVGDDSTNFSTGNFYQCVEDDYPTTECTSDTQWANLEVDSWTFANYISKYFYNSDLNSVPSKLYTIEYVNQYNGLGWLLQDNQTVVYSKDLLKLGITAEGATPEVGDCIYVQLYMHQTTNWTWKKLLIDAQISVNNTLTSTSTKQALSANQGRVLNDKIQELSGISHFLAMWDADTGIARYLDAGYHYASGDYFIIASVASDEGEDVNYKPAGISYSGDVPASREVTEDPVQISDMYFYDGSHWIFLPSSSRQIAVDEQLDDSSKNPVENRVVTNALDSKLNASTTEGIYATDDSENDVKLSIGAGLAVENGELVNTRTGGTWGQITGNIESQTDLVNYVASHGGSGSLQIADVFTKDGVINDTLDYEYKSMHKAKYADILFKINANYDSIKNQKNDLYFTLARNNDSNHARSTHKFRLMNEENRFKTDKKFHCWRIANQSSAYYYDTDEGYWTWGDKQPVRETDYSYFYVEGDYEDSSDMVSENPMVFVTGTYNEQFTQGCWGSNFNQLESYGNLNDEIDDAPYERCERYDIDSVVSLNSDFSGDDKESEYHLGNVVKRDFIKMFGRCYNSPTGKVYLWCDDWDDDGASVYCYLDEDDNIIPNEIPSFMGDLQDSLIVSDLEQLGYTLVEKRPDLNWYKYNLSSSEFTNKTINDLRLSTQDFPDQDDGTSGYLTNWNSYWFDYPIKPVRLSDCKVYLYKAPVATEEWTGGDISDCLRRSYTFKEIDDSELLTYIAQNQDDLILVSPYDTAYVWMRLFGWQKYVYYHIGSDDDNVYAEPWERHDVYDMIKKGDSSNGGIGSKGRMFGFRKNDFDYNAVYFQRIHFGLSTADEIGHKKESSTPSIPKRLWINGQGNQGITEQ